MTSTFTPLGFEKQGTGDNENTWGEVLNAVLALIDEAIRGRAAFSLTGTYTLDATNGVSNEARCALLHATAGTGGTVVIPAISKLYLAWNESSGNMIVSCGGATTTTVEPGDLSVIWCDGTKVRQPMIGGYTFREYVAAATLSEVELPAQASNDGKFLKTDGTNATWQQPGPADLSTFGATAAQIWAAASALLAVTPIGAKQARARVPLTFAATVTPDLSLGRNFTLDASASFILGAPINAFEGADFEIMITNTAGSIVVTYDSAYNRENGDLTISPTNGHKNKLLFLVETVDVSNVGTDVTYGGQRNRT